MLNSQPTLITDYLPKSLDDIIRIHRNRYSLTLASDEEITRLTRPIQCVLTKDTLYRWQILAFHFKEGRKFTATYHLVGPVRGAGKYRMTSKILAIDRKLRRVQTENSVYGLWGKPGGETDIDLLYVCATLNIWGVGKHMGVPELFY